MVSKQVIGIYKAGIYSLVIFAVVSIMSGCSTISWVQTAVSQQETKAILATSGDKKLYPAVRPPQRVGLSQDSVQFLEKSEVGSRGRITVDKQVLNVTVQDEYTAANGRFCKKALAAPTRDIPQQLLALCKKPPDEPWRLTRSVLSITPDK